MKLPICAALALSATTLALPTAASAAPIAFAVTPTAFVLGAGYGTDANEAVGSLLDISFTVSPTPAFATLENVGDAFTFEFGRIVFNESGLIREAELDDLGVLAVFTFADPLSGLRTVSAAGEAIVGPVVDPAIDFSIAWTPREVSFGNGGRFSIAMDAQNFRQAGASRIQSATITLLAAPASVPEPASLALTAGALLLGATAARRRRG